MSYLKNVFLVTGTTQSIPHDNKTKTDNKVALQLLASELKEILKEKAEQQLSVNEVMFSYNQRYKQNMKVEELGFRHLSELLQALPGLQVCDCCT